MTVDVEERLRAYAVTLDHAIEARRSPTQGARPLDHSTRGDRRPRTRTLVASACVAAVVATVIVAAASGRSDHRALTSSNPVAGESAVPVPGITASAETPSPNTAANGVFADRVTRIVGPLWSSAVVEKQTRVTLAGATVQWVYLSDGDRRLFVTTGPSGELSDEPGLLDRLNLVDDANSQHVYAWPAEPIANTVAVVTNDQTVIVRSEAIESTGTPRPISDLTALLRRIAPPSVSGVTGDSQTATTVPTESTTTTTATTSPATPTTVDGIPLDQLGVEAGPVALGTVPDGYRPVMAFTDPAATPVTNQTVPTAADGWSATYIRVPEIGQSGVAPYLSVMIENITNDDPYWGYPGTLTATDTMLGAFSGRFDNSTPGYPEFIARLND
ncbi:MAG: hypothetical protein JWN39_2463, partial [Ilumatobacteraceae bacterium]|nr:hypothetical protein [Ilumatobacteraceae bacterium]